jgi:acetyl-CoA carboxylase biotin carboxyl carrier protein
MAVDRELRGLMDPERIARIMDLMESRGVASFRMRSGDQELEVHWPRLTTALCTPADEPEEMDGDPLPPHVLHAVTSPTVGTYFASSEPGKEPFVRVGEAVSAGQTICVVESMKLMNEIAADSDGIVEELPVQNGGSVQAGEVVCLLRVEQER